MSDNIVYSDKKIATNRVILNVPIVIDEQMKELACKRGIYKSQLMIYAISWWLDYNKTIDLLPKLVSQLDDLKK